MQYTSYIPKQKIMFIFFVLFISSLLTSSFQYGIGQDNFSTHAENRDFEIRSTEVTNNINFDLQYPKIAFVKPTFTAAAYSGFYSCFSTPRVDASTCFVKPEQDSWSTSASGYNYIQAMIAEGYPSEKISIIKDSTVHKGLIFDELGQPLYSTLLFFHNEYVSLEEYYNLVKFMKAGGNVIILNGNAFFAEVDYNEVTNDVILVSGHGWTFDGYNQSSSGNYRGRFRDDQNSFEHWKWFGSVYTNFNSGSMQGAVVNTTTKNTHPIAAELQKQGISTIAPNIFSHEENSLITTNAHIIADWQTSFTQWYRGLKIYEIFPEGPYGGSLIHFGFFGSDKLPEKPSARKAVLTAIRHQAGYFSTPWIKYPMTDSVLSNNIVLQFTSGWETKIWIDHIEYFNLRSGSSLDFLSEGQHNLTIQFSINNISQINHVVFSIDRTKPKILYNGNSDFSLPVNYPNTLLEIKVDDPNPEYIRFALYGDYASFSVYSVVYGNPVFYFGGGANDAKWGTVEVMDSAGNWYQEWFLFNSSNPTNPSRKLMPKLEKINENALKVSFDTPEINTKATLQISENFGSSWQNIDFNETDLSNDKIIAYFEKNNENLWYRVKLENGGDITYVRNVRSYQWENTIYSVANTSLTPSIESGSNQYVLIKKTQYQSNNIKLSWLDNSGNIVASSELGYLSGSWDNITFTVPSLPEGYYRLIVTIEDSEHTVSLPFDIFIDHNPSEVKSTIEMSYNSIIFTHLNFTALSNQLFNILIYSNSESSILLSINSNGFDQIELIPLQNTNISVILYDTTGAILYSYLIINSVELIPPEILGEPSITLYTSDLNGYVISWTIMDFLSGSYSISVNGINVESGSYDGVSSIDLILTEGFIGTLTIIVDVVNSENLIVNFTTIVTILPNQSSEPSTSTSNLPSTSSSEQSSGFGSQSSSNSIEPTSETKPRSNDDDSPVYLPPIIVLIIFVGFIRKIRLKTLEKN